MIIIYPSNENKIFKAVPRPVICIFPHKRHFSHETQSIIRDTFLNWNLISLIKSYYCYCKKKKKKKKKSINKTIIFDTDIITFKKIFLQLIYLL